MNVLLGLIELVRDVAVIAAVVAGALALRHALELMMAHRAAGERLAIEHASRSNDAAARVEAALGAISRELGLLVASKRDEDAERSMGLRVHALLQSTSDPFLTFEEIRAALALSDVATITTVDAPASENGRTVEADLLRRVLIGLVRDRVVTQLDRDRYFIASDFDTDDSSGASLDDSA